MRLWLLTTGLCAGGILTLAGCGTPGAPLPPTLNLPQPVMDLAAERHGNTVSLRWTTPAKTTDKLLLRGDIGMTLCRKADATQCTPVPGATLTAGAAASYDDLLPPQLTTGAPRLLEYRLTAANSHGRSAGESNSVLVVGGEGPQGVTALTAAVIERGVLLHWHRETEPQQRVMYVLHREALVGGGLATGKTAHPTQRLTLTANNEMDPGIALDDSVNPGGIYRYTVERVERVDIDGKSYDLSGFMSEPVTVEVRDIFPPRVPARLAAVGTAASVGTPESSEVVAIDLSWSANTERDLLGYFLYRRDLTTGEASPIRLNGSGVSTPGERDSNAGQPTSLLRKKALPAPAFHDTTVIAGHRYAYSVSAVDLSGNESARSPEIQETAPR